MKNSFSESNTFLRNFTKGVLLILLVLSGGISAHAAESGIPQQAKVISGVVKDANGELLTGVSVRIAGTASGTITDLNGVYKLQAKTGQSLEFSYIGFVSQTIPVGESTTLNVTLKEDNKVLDEVVVVGYGSMKRSEIATAITTVKAEEFNISGAANRDVRSVLEGRVAGLAVTRTGGSSPTDGVAIQLRGVVSINGSKSPLVIIDGIPGGNLNLLRADDIESIEVLKDGSAAAIYGSSANAGVIIISTKKGQEGRSIVEYSTYANRYYKANTPEFFNAEEYKSALSSLGFDTDTYDRGGNSNMYDELINKNNLSHSHSLSVSGGTKSTSYRASLFYNQLEGVAKANEREQWGGRLSLTTKGLNDMLTFQTNISTNFDSMDRLGNEGWESVLRANPSNPIYKEDGSFYEDYASDENKLARLSQQKNIRNENTTGLDAKAILEPIKDLKISLMGSMTRNTYDDNKYYNKNSRTSYDSYNNGGYAYKSHYVNNKGAIEPTVEYSKTLFDKQKFAVMGGYSWQQEIWESFEAWNVGFLNDATEENDLGAGSYLTTGKAGMGSDKQESTLIAFFGRFNYVFDNKYIFQASLRHEGSSKFGPNNKWGNFPSVSLAWNVTHEKFMQAVPTISSLKLRLGYGETGNSGISPYQSFSTLGTGNPYLTDAGTWQQTYGPNKNPNPNLKWETKKEWNLGIDFGVMKNRITGAVDVYKRQADDLLMTGVTAPIPANIHSTYTTNIGSVSSSGIELTLNAVAVSTKSLKWDIMLTASKLFSNKLDKFSANSADYYSTGDISGYGALGNAVRLYEGDDIGNFYGKRFAGFDEKGEWLFFNKNEEKVSASKMTDADQTVIGNGVPKWNMGLTNTVRYKGFDLTVGFIGKFQFDVLNRQKMAYGNIKTLRSGYNVLRSALTDGIDASYQYSDYYLEKGNYLKLDNVTLGYTLPRNILPIVSSARFYVSGRDLLFITSYSGETPELDDTGLAPSMAPYARTPLTRSITVGCNIRF